MHRITGQVLVKETGMGIANLQIVLYDLDKANAVVAAQTPLERFPDPKGVLFWQNVPGDRLGSVVTDGDGRFQIMFDENAFRPREQDMRPDLVLFVVAPEDSLLNAKGDAEPYADSTRKRILHYSYDVVANSGTNEAYVIRISEQLLKRSGIAEGSSIAQSQSATYLMRIQDAHLVERNLQQSEAPLLKIQQKQQRQRRQASEKFIADLSSAPPHVQKSPFFIGEAKSKKTAKKLEHATHEAHRVGMDWLAEYRETAHPEVTFDITDERLRDLERRGVIRPDLSGYFVNSICSLLSSTINGVALERVRTLIESRRMAPPALDPESPVVPGADPVLPPAGLTAEEQIRQRVLGQIQYLETPSLNGASNGVMDNLLKMLQELKSSQTGPADVAALKDFHSLQIAFPHVWVEAFDDRLREGTRRLYEETVRLHEDYGLEPPQLENLREVNDYRNFLNEVRGTRQLAVEPVPEAIAAFFPDLTMSIWNGLSAAQKLALVGYVHGLGVYAGTVEERREGGSGIIRNAQGALSRVERLALELETMLSEPYAFHYFAPNSVNFGLMVTYRQEWKPETYQVGDLVATIPLAPNETRKFTTKQVVKTQRAQKEIEKSLSSRNEESQQTQRAEDEILNRAQVSTNFQMTAQGSINFGIGEIGASTQFSLNQVQESSRVKKSFHEAVMKASFEYKSERSLEVETTSEKEMAGTTSGDLTNPNNEITVTYLLYELERRYNVSEKLQRVAPVILVAQDMPAPHEIDEDWLLAHEWILRRVLLDDSLQTALNFLSKEFVRSEVSMEVRKANWQKQKELVSRLEGQVERFLNARDNLREALGDLTRRTDVASESEPSDVERGFLAVFTGGLSEIGGAFSGASDSEKLEAQRKVAEKRLEYLKESLTDAQLKLSSAAEALNQATNQYTRALEDQSSQRTSIDQLRMHVKQNILHYMQAIWDHEPPDQRFFRLYHVNVDLPSGGTETCRLRLATAEEISRGVPGIRREGRLYIVECSSPTPPSPESRVTKTLVEIADLDRPLGFKGNYMIFPLKECTYLTGFMMQEYIDDYFGLHDPDPLGDFTTDELLSYAESVRPELNTEERRSLDQMISERLSHPRRESDTIIVPTGQLFIEALTGAHSLLEPFKMLHRGMDVAKVETEVREMNLENLRKAARLIGNNQEDPDIDKKIVVEGNLHDVTVRPEV